MKMKKTQSLKLMLLGLMALVSGSAFAAVGDIFVSGNNAGGQLYYQQIAAKGAKLIGVQTVGQGGNIVIPTKAINTWMNNGNDLDVIEVADNWSLATEVATQKVDANGNVLERYPQGKSKALTDYEGTIKLTIDAEELKTISTKALQPLNGKISKFVVSPDAGLTAIPDYAFLKGTETTPIVNEDVAKAITALERQKAIVDYIIDGFENGTLTDGTPVYKLDGTPEGEGYVILGEEAGTDPENGAPSAGTKPVYKVLQILADGTTAVVKDADNNEVIARENSAETKYVYNGVELASRVTTSKTGLQDQYDDAQTEINTINGAIGTLANNTDYINANNAYQDALQRKADADGAIALYALVSALWEQATPAVTNAVANGNPNEAGLTANEKQLVTDILAAMANAVYTNEAGKQYRYSKTGAGYARPSVQGMNEEQRNAEADVTTKENAIKDIKTDAGNFRMFNMFELEDALAAAQDDKAAIEPYLNYRKGQRDGIAAQIKDKQDNELYTPVYAPATDLFGNVLDNEVLKIVNLNGKNLVSIGTSAFENCVKAGFGPGYGGPQSRIPVTTKTIGARAFYNSPINPEFDTLVDLESIGDFAFAKTGATTANFSGATKLASFGTNVFDDCKLKNLLLLGTPLKAIPGNLAEGIYRDYANFVDACGNEWNKDGAKDVLVNQTLKVVSLPLAITAIREDNFANCLNLTTLTGGIPVGVETIGAEAFFRTKIKEFDLSLLSKLTFIGEKAFAGNAQLTKVILPQNPEKDYALTELPDNVFECDDNLADVILGPDVTCLPEGIFAGNTSMKKLDLSNTQIEILYDLFKAGDGTDKDEQGKILNPVNNTLVEIILPEETRDLDGNIITPGLKIIMDYALANLQALKGAKQADGTYKMVIPSSVYIMRPGVFSNDISLEYVEAMDSRLTNLGVKTFESCTSLKEFKFITLLPINPAWVNVPAGGLANMECGNSEDGVIVGFETKRWVLDPAQPAIVGLETNKIYEWTIDPQTGEKVATADFSDKYEAATIALNSKEGVNYGTEYVPVWGPGIKFDAATFNFDDMQFHGNHETPVQVWVTEESNNNLQGYYRQTYDNNLGQYSKLNVYAFKLKLDKIKDGSYARTYYSTDFGTWIDTKEAGVFTAYQDYESVVLFKAKHNGGYFKIPASHAPSTGREFAPDGTNYYAPGNFIWSADDVAKPHNSAAVVIVSDKEEITIKRVTKPNEIYQSTLDRDNELRIAAETLEPSTHYPVHGFTFYHELPVFYPYTSGKLNYGTVVLKASDYQGTGSSARIMNIIFVDDEATTIMGVKEYVKSLHNSDVIYNLNGMQVTTPVKGQIYIKGGKKFIQK